MRPATQKIQYRNNLRIIARNTSIAQELYERLAHVLNLIDQDIIVCTNENCSTFLNDGFGMNGTWKLSSLNSCFRLCKYHPGGHFGPHYDGDYVVDPVSSRSLKTFMIYLNDDYEGGETNFCDDHTLHFSTEKQIYCSPEGAIFSQLKARAGDCLVFDHHLLHEGGVVKEGVKYLMRSDVMYLKEERLNFLAMENVN